ncbi:MAG: hypothetical protein V4627_15420 [Pseudomonadota bacterium]
MTHLFRRLGFFIAAWGLLLASSAAFAGSPSVLTFTKAFGASSIEINGSTSLTFNLSLNNVGGGGGTGAFGFADALPVGLVVSTPNGLSAVTCSGGSTAGSVTASPGMGSITLAGMNLAMLGNCSFSVNITATSAGTKNNSVTTTAAYYTNTPGGMPTTITATASLAVGQLIPNLTPAPTTGIGAQPTTVNLSQGQGPTMTSCMMDAVKGMEGFSQAVYLGQDAYGVASIDLKDGRYLSFYPLSASTDTSRAPGLYFSGSNIATLATSCGSFDIVPAVYNIAKLGSLLAVGQSADVRVNFNADGVATYVQGDNTYVARPDFYVTRGAAGTAALALAGGAYRFNDGAGNTQLLRGAFADADVLRSALASAGVLGNLVGLADGVFLFTSTQGTRCLLQAQMQLLPASTHPSGLYHVQGDGNFFLYRGNELLMWQRMGFTCF